LLLNRGNQPTRFKEKYLMVERGIVKIYFGSRSYSKKRFGFIRVIGENGVPTGEEVYFHLNQCRQPHFFTTPSNRKKVLSFSDIRVGIGYLDGEPLRGDTIVFEAASNGGKRRRVTAWTTETVWREFLDDEFWSTMDSLTEADFERGCPGGCGQPESSCTCAELASLRAHNSMTDGYWTA
jgi:hypothetical protein